MTQSEGIHVRVPLRTAVGDYITELFMALAPHDAFSNRVKRALMRWRGATVGRNPKIWRDVWVDDYRKLVIGDDVSIGKSAMLLCIGSLTIGDQVMVAHGAQIITAGHVVPPGARRCASPGWRSRRWRSRAEPGSVEVRSSCRVSPSARAR